MGKRLLESRKSVIISLVAIFAALHAVLGMIPGIWRSWMIVIEPLEGVILGPVGGFISALIGGLLARFIRPRTAIMYIFGLGEPIGACIAGLVFKGRYILVVAVYTVMLAAYFIHPVGRSLPAWCLWDVYLAYIAVLSLPIISRISKELNKPVRLIMSAFIGSEADVLTRIFLFIPVELYKVMGVPEEALPAIWVAGAFETPIEVVISVLAIVAIGVPLLRTLDKSRIIQYPVT